MSNIDLLMSKDPLDLTAQDIDAIVEYQRQARRNFEAGVKPKKETGPKADLSELVQRMTGAAPQPSTPIRRL